MFELAGMASDAGVDGLGAETWNDMFKSIVNEIKTVGAGYVTAQQQARLAKAQAKIAAGQGNMLATSETNWTPWIVGGAAVLLLGGGLLLARRKRR